jgi:hypothetical protein
LRFRLTPDGDAISWTLQRAAVFGLGIPSFVAPRISAREWLAAEKYPSGEPHLPFQVKRLSSVLMDDLKVAHKYGGDDGA